MNRVPRKTQPNARLDALIALPLGRFRIALTRVSLDELAMVQRRISTRLIGARWARGGRGIVRHQAMGELGWLIRREEATALERYTRRGEEPKSINALPAPDSPQEAVTEVDEELAA